MKAGDNHYRHERIKTIIYKCEKVDVECKKAESNVSKGI